MNRFLPALLVVVAFFVGLAILAPESERRWFVGFYALMSALSFSLYGLDKRASVRGGWRTPEARLHLVELLGALGWLLFADVGPGWPLLSGLGERLRGGL